MARLTTRNVRLASWGRRALGFLLDLLVMAIAPIALLVALGATSPNDSNAPVSPASVVLVLGFWLSCSVFVLYPAWYIGRRAQTPGMRRMGLRLYAVDREGNLDIPGKKAAWIRAATATACWLLLFAWVLDYLWPIETELRQCLHDKAARTVAVDERDA
jgi:uncharacterized RDD family membrane protein YckC